MNLSALSPQLIPRPTTAVLQNRVNMDVFRNCLPRQNLHVRRKRNRFTVSNQPQPPYNRTVLITSTKFKKIITWYYKTIVILVRQINSIKFRIDVRVLLFCILGLMSPRDQEHGKRWLSRLITSVICWGIKLYLRGALDITEGPRVHLVRNVNLYVETAGT